MNALVWAPDGPVPAKGAHPAATAAVEQCRIVPHLIVTNPGAELSLINRDALYHNVSGTGALKFSYALVLKGHAVPVHMKKPGLTVLGSTNHPWMHAFVQVLPTAVWGLTGADGSYFIDLPPGRHGLKVWHEQLGEQLDLVDVHAGGTTLKDFTFAPR